MNLRDLYVRNGDGCTGTVIISKHGFNQSPKFAGMMGFPYRDFRCGLPIPNPPLFDGFSSDPHLANDFGIGSSRRRRQNDRGSLFQMKRTMRSFRQGFQDGLFFFT